MEEKLVIYCSRCEMWFDTKNGWKAHKTKSGLPLCPSCLSPLFQIEADQFYKNNSMRLDLVMTWEWPNGSLWKERKVLGVEK